MSIENNDFRETKSFLLSVVGAAPYGIITMQKDGRITMINSLAKKYLEIPFKIKEIAEKSIFDFIVNIPELTKVLEKRLRSDRKPFDIEVIPFRDRFLSVKGRPIFEGMMITVENISRLKEMEAEILTSMFEGQEQVRRRIAKEIHDGLGPLLSTIRLNLENVQSEIEMTPLLQKRFEDAFILIDTVTGELRSISHDLMPKVLEDFGLVAALENLCKRVNETNRLSVHFYASEHDERFDRMIELSLYRISQELINNAIKHSKAGRLTVQLIRHQESLVLMVEDDGLGFQDDNPWEPGIGLTNIETRATALGGTFVIDSVKGKGVVATVEIPVYI